MMCKVNYYQLMEKEIKSVVGKEKKPRLLLHSCCAPCSSVPVEMLCEFFEVTVLYYNPNIYPESEYHKRSREQERFCREYFGDKKTDFVALEYDGDEFKKIADGLENEPELGKRCTQCYRLRLEKSAQYAAQNGFEYFTTTLSISPMKDAHRLNEIGSELGKAYNVSYLYSDFKKKEGYKRSCEISERFGMYRQDYCGCVYSMVERYLARAKGIIFDVDGTLCDTMGFYENFLGEYLRKLGIEPKDDLREAVRGLTIAQAYRYIIKEYAITKPQEEIFADAGRMFADFYSNHALLKEGVREFMDYASGRGIRMCIATATNREYIELMMKNLGIEKYIEFVVTSPEVGKGKQFPDIYNTAAERLECNTKNVIVFEDAFHAVQTAKEAGYTVFAVKDEYQMKFEDEIRKYSDIYIDSMSSLIDRSNL